MVTITSDDLVQWFEDRIGRIDVDDFFDFTDRDIQSALYNFGIDEANPSYKQRAAEQLESPILGDSGGIATRIFKSDTFKRRIINNITAEGLKHLFKNQRRLWFEVRNDIRRRGGGVVVKTLTDNELLQDIKSIQGKHGSKYFLSRAEAEQEAFDRGLI